jgi:hypothetical protein
MIVPSELSTRANLRASMQLCGEEAQAHLTDSPDRPRNIDGLSKRAGASASARRLRSDRSRLPSAAQRYWFAPLMAGGRLVKMLRLTALSSTTPTWDAPSGCQTSRRSSISTV